MTPKEYARAVAGNTALRIVAADGPDTGCEKLQGAFIAFARALMALMGKPALVTCFHEAIGIPEPEPVLVHSNDKPAA